MTSLDHYVTADHPDWVCVAAVDDSEQYEIDVTEIWHGDGQFWLVTASGCSCWDGEYGVEGYDTLDDLDRAYWDERAYHASLAAHQAMLITAHHWRAT